jgi:ParB-like chromosome segregation protein Spo0J
METLMAQTEVKASLQPISTEMVARSALSEHPRNPRKMTDAARKKLDSGLDRYGLLAPILVNRRTGHVVGGHQRLAWLDAKNQGKEYELQVSYCDIPEQEELTVGALLNNPSAQGEWDIEKLETIFDDGSLNAINAAFDEKELNKLFAQVQPSDKASRVKIKVEVECPKCGHKFER